MIHLRQHPIGILRPTESARTMRILEGDETGRLSRTLMVVKLGNFFRASLFLPKREPA